MVGAPRAGLGVVELLVALVVIATGLTALASAAALARRLATGARVEERGLAAAAAVLDSLAAEAAPTGGAVAGNGFRLRWHVADDDPLVTLELVFTRPAADSVRRRLQARLFATPPRALDGP